jgi:translation initiation factor 2B subunit (eIF-2B alpha/beta/delta family)
MSNVTMDANPEIQERIAALTEDRESRATALAYDALDILEAVAGSFPEDGLGAYLDGVGVLLMLSRPTMASVKNTVSRALADGPLSHPGQAKRAFQRARPWIDFAVRAAAEEVAATITDGTTILICSYSGTVITALSTAARKQKGFRVLCIASEVDGVAHGQHMADGLVAEGLQAIVIPDGSALAEQKPTLALIGADRVCPDGSLVHGTPSLAFAGALGGVAPLYVACETFKLDDDNHIEPGFDRVPGDLVAGYITDRGVVQPSQVWGLRQHA